VGGRREVRLAVYHSEGASGRLVLDGACEGGGDVGDGGVAEFRGGWHVGEPRVGVKELMRAAGGELLQLTIRIRWAVTVDH
jgi:hypothetical protein